MSILNRHVTLASEPQGMGGVYATSCHWATFRRLHNPGTMGLQVPDFTTDSEGMLTVGPDARVDPDPQPETATLASRTPIEEAVNARRPLKRGVTGGRSTASR